MLVFHYNYNMPNTPTNTTIAPFLKTVFVLAWAFFVVFMTLAPNGTPLVVALRTFIGGTALSDAAGHAGLFALLSAGVYVAARRWLPWRLALVCAVTAALFLGTATELGQALAVNRTASLVDLLANWLGVFVVGTGVGLLPHPDRATSPSQRPTH